MSNVLPQCFSMFSSLTLLPGNVHGVIFVKEANEKR